MIVKTEADVAQLLQFIVDNEVLAYDTETTGLNVRKDRIIGFGISNETTSYYIPIYTWNSIKSTLESANEIFCKEVLEALKNKKLLCFNASFDLRITKNNLEVDLLPILHADVLLLKHTCDEEFPFGLKEIATKLWGHSIKEEKEAMLKSIKANGGTAKEYYKADTELLAKYCEQDCLLTFKLFNYYSRQLERDGLTDFFYRDEVMPLYKECTIPMEEQGVKLDLPKLNQTLSDIVKDISALEQGIQEAITPHLSLFTTWFLNKDYPEVSPTGRMAAWTRKHNSQFEAWRAVNPNGYMFNLQSKHHLKKLFFDTLKCKPLSKTPTGLPQVDEEFMESVKEQLPWVNQLIEFNKLNKIKSTYLERFLHEQEDGIFYPSFLQHRTVSGRYAGDLQQLPRPRLGNSLVDKYTSIIRELIIAPAGSKLISADYEQLEPRVFAHTSGDAKLAQIFAEGKDFYFEVAKDTEGITDITTQIRNKAKKYALGIAYGMTGYKLKFELGCTDEEADALVEKYLTAFPDLRRWMNESKEKAISEGVIRASSGRMRRLPRAKAIYAKYGPVIRDSLQLWKTYHNSPAIYAQAKQDYKTFKNECNNAINFQVQGYAAGIVNRAAIIINRKLKTHGYKTKLIMQIHDELVYESPDNEFEWISTIIKDAMENTTKLSVPLITTPQIGANFKACK